VNIFTAAVVDDDDVVVNNSVTLMDSCVTL